MNLFSFRFYFLALLFFGLFSGGVLLFLGLAGGLEVSGKEEVDRRRDPELDLRCFLDSRRAVRVRTFRLLSVDVGVVIDDVISLRAVSL